MLGAIIGDIVGSRFELNNYRGKDFELFHPDCHLTDDSIMTLAVGQALMQTAERAGGLAKDADFLALLEEETVRSMQAWGRKYPTAGYGKNFFRWIYSRTPQPYQSIGNGAGMRISPVADLARSEEEVLAWGSVVTGISHDSEEAFLGAWTLALAIYQAKTGVDPEDIFKQIATEVYDLNFTIDDLRPHYSFHANCADSIPQALVAVRDSEDFEDCLRLAVSLGGDSDTIASMAGAMAAYLYPIPQAIADQALSYLDDDQAALYQAWQDFCRKYQA
ncbi:ADP-ribosylglycohydrolase family protein [Aerococcus sp. UMB7834]|uniref:ADP-ribosylglycohydrolase family protein n=1 Tax=Aerococcus sp. UMB7834 TaxID=3046342 RepID=UPI00254F9650|nr:ADP-ribosylglycohydrolase family protein [Aerococcus sp. UMB7834]MDK6804214.1 ADP-ribosylglycohydrolase family protein [Aerococcus sp. UMB7834]